MLNIRKLNDADIDEVRSLIVYTIKVTYVDDFAEQMLKYSKEYSFLPVMN